MTAGCGSIATRMHDEALGTSTGVVTRRIIAHQRCKEAKGHAMSTKEEPRESTYMLGTENDAEMARLLNQDQVLNRTMGLLPPGLELRDGDRVLDAACGPAGWTRALAQKYPTVQVLGVDISQIMLAYANTVSQAQRLSNISFQSLDITKPWELADASFDLVNARLMVGFLTDEKWQHVIAEMLRVLAPGGTIVLTESDETRTNSPAFETLLLHNFRSARRAGLSHHPLGHHMGITPLLGRYLQQAGVTEIRQEAHVLDLSAGAPGHLAIIENLKIAQKLVQAHIVRQGIATQQELDALYEQLLNEFDSPDFRGIWYFLRVWGKKPTGISRSSGQTEEADARREGDA